MGIIEQLVEMKEQEGLKKGLQQGEEKANRLFVENLLKEGSFSLQKIASLVNVSVTFVKKVKTSLQTGIEGLA